MRPQPTTRGKERVMSTTPKPGSMQTDRFFTGAEARSDRWRRLLDASRSWEAAAPRQAESAKESAANEVSTALQELKQWEHFFAFPGAAQLNRIEERIDAGDAAGTTRLLQAINTALLTHSYRTNGGDWNAEEQSVSLGDRLPFSSGDGATYRPYFEVLVVSPARATAWPEMTQEFRRLRRPNEKFIYEL